MPAGTWKVYDTWKEYIMALDKMSDATLTPTTPREIRLCREAYASALIRAGDSGVMADRRAKHQYPMPTIAVPRVATDGVFNFRVVNGLVQFVCLGGHDWRLYEPERQRVIAALLADPVIRQPADEVDTRVGRDAPVSAPRCSPEACACGVYRPRDDDDELCHCGCRWCDSSLSGRKPAAEVEP